MILKKIKILRKKFKQYKIDGYIIPKNDEYFSEYAKNDRLKNITGFSGSAGFAVVLKKQNYLFVDGRYTIQAHQQSSKNFKIIEIHKKLPHTIIKNFNLGYDPTLFTSKLLNKYFKNNNLISIDQNLIDQIFKFKEKPTKPFYSLDTKIVGEPYSSKISKVVRFLKNNKADYCFISAPENVAWLLNIRGYDNPNSPIANARLILNKKKEIFLIANEKRLKNLLLEKKIKKKQILPIKSLPQFLDDLKGKNFIIDNKTCSIFYEKIIKSNFNILEFDDPVYELKSIKNSNEIKHMIESP
jgi:Xaa-Pro aminopeptidase